MPGAFQLLAVEAELEVPLAIAELGIELRRPGALVPHHHRAGAIFALRDHALEVAIFQRMVLDMDREPLLVGDEARPFRHGPALEDAVQLQAEIVVHPARGVLLDDVRIFRGGIAALGRGLLAGGLRRLRKIPLGSVGIQGLAHRAGV
jgi:hypothetical protein